MVPLVTTTLPVKVDSCCWSSWRSASASMFIGWSRSAARRRQRGQHQSAASQAAPGRRGG
jgi:hypothetical protein